MGFVERLKEVASGVGDLVTAPIGLVWDTVRATTSEQYNPGFFGVFGPAAERAVGGLAQVGEAIGFNAGLAVVGETPVGQGLKSFWDEVETAYSTEFQRAENQTPWGLRPGDPLHDLVPFRPGEASIQRAVSLGSQYTLAGLIRHPEALTGEGAVEAWRISGNQSPGQGIYENVLTNFRALNPQQQEAVKASAHYNMFTGTLDAVARWYMSPDIIAGKGLKYLRNQQFIFDAAKHLNLATKKMSPSGLRVTHNPETLDGMRSITLNSTKRGQQVYAVERSSGLEQLVEEGSLNLRRGMDEMVDGDDSWRVAQQLEGRKKVEVDADALNQEIRELAPEIGISTGNPLGDVVQHYALRGIDAPDPVASLDELLLGIDNGDPGSMNALIDALEAGGASDNMVSAMADQFRRMAGSRALGRANEAALVGGILPDTGRVSAPQRWPGTSYRPVVLFTDELAAKRYAATLHQQNPSDMPVLMEVDAKGLQAVYEEFDLPLAEQTGDGALFTMANKLEGNNVTLRRLSPDDLEAEAFIPDTRANLRIYNQDGSAIEPDQVISFDDLRMDFETAMRTDGETARKFLASRNAARAMAGGAENVYDAAANNKVVQQVLNHMAGKNATQIRDLFFPKHPLGQRIALDLADAKDYNQRRTILLAYMGYRLPEVDALPGIMRAKIDILHKEWDNVRNGLAPNEEYLGLIGQPGRFTDVPLENMDSLFKEVLDELENAELASTFLADAMRYAPIRQVSVPYPRLAGNLIRKTSWYQQSHLARPIQVVTEMKPHRFMNVRDGMSDDQLRRQLQEARSLGVTAQEVTRFRQRYMEALTDEAKVDVVSSAERLIIEKAARIAKLTPEELQKAIDVARFGHHRVQTYLASRRYGPGDRDMVKMYDQDTGIWTIQAMPLLDTQVQAWVPLADVSEIIKAARNVGRLRSRYGKGARGLTVAMDSFYAVWKPSVLLRGGWMLRVVSDEQLRILANSGSLLRHLAAIEAGERPSFFGIFMKDLPLGQRVAEAYAVGTLTRPLTAASTRVASWISMGARKLQLTDPDYWNKIKDLEIEPQVSARAPFGGPNESILNDMQTLLGRDADHLQNHFRTKATGQWQTVVRGQREFGPAWTRVLTRQFGESPAGRNIVQSVLEHTRGTGVAQLDDAARADVIRKFRAFLSDTKEGRVISQNLHYRAKDPERWANDLIETLNDYTAGFSDELMDGVLRRKITQEMLEKVDERLRPDAVHAEIIDQVLGRSPINQFISDFVSHSYDLIGRLPTDTLSRQPFYKQLFGLEMQRLERLHAVQGLDLTEDAIQSMARSARALAARESRDLLYDLAEVSRLGDMMRFITPFYAAWQEVVTVWTGLTIRDPSILGRARTIWTAPNRSDMVYTDDEGNEFIQLRLSERSANNLGLTGWARYLATGGVRLGKSSFNLVLNNPLPGVGPLIQYPVNEVVKKKPELEAAVQFLLPFGVAVDSKQIFLSPLIRQLGGEMQGPESDRSYIRAWQDGISWMDVEHRLGNRAAPTEEEAHDIASKLWTMRLLTRLWSPVQPIFDSPLQPYIDTYRDMIDNLGPEAADEAFLNEYGQEFFAVTLSRTVSATGIPPTVEAEVARRSYENLIEQYPEYGRLILGDRALGEFSTGAYAAQLERKIDPDNPSSNEMERIYRSTELDPRTGRVMEIDRRLGWQEYIRAMDAVDLLRRQQNLPNLRVREAETLKAYRDQIIDQLRAQYPSWWDDFNTRDELKWPRRIEAFREIAADPGVTARADIQGLQDYLAARSQFIQELNRRSQLGGSSTLEAIANQDLAFAWDSVVNAIIEDNVAFGPLYFRYLEGDPLSSRSAG